MPPKSKARKTQAKTSPSEKKQPLTIVSYILSNGGIETFRDKKDAKLFEKENELLIDDKRIFKSEDAFQAFKENHDTTTPTKTSNNDLSLEEMKVSPKEASKLKEALDRIETSRPSDSLTFYWRTSTRAQKVVILIRFLNAEGQDDWRMKAEALVSAIKNHAASFKIRNATVNNALMNMDIVTKRDPNGAPDQAATKEWKSPTTQKISYFKFKLAYTWFTLPKTPPNKKKWSQGLEETFIKETCRDIGQAIINKLHANTFVVCFKSAINNDKIWSAITDQNNPGKHYMTFVKHAKVRVEEIENFNRLVVKEDAAKLVTIIYESGRGLPMKYEVEDIESDEDDDDDDDDECVIEEGGGDKENSATVVNTAATHQEEYLTDDEGVVNTRSRKRVTSPRIETVEGEHDEEITTNQETAMVDKE